MISLLRRWALPAALASAALGLAACAGNSGSPVPLAPSQMLAGGLHLGAVRAMEPGAGTCPTTYINCFTVSLKKGLKITWCDGTTANPCADTNMYTWSGEICLAKAKACGKKSIKQFTVKWTGPFKCTKKACKGFKTQKGYYELDTIGIGKTPPKQEMTLEYKQAIDLNGAVAGYIGLNVGP
jgi:hypothetical protein